MEFSPTAVTEGFKRQQELALLLSKATPERRAIFEKLQSKQWFQQTAEPLVGKSVGFSPN